MINQALTNEEKRVKLLDLSHDFSYIKYVTKSRQAIMGNCSNEMEDLFKKMLNPRADERMTFWSIR